jgi:hypothetical protein
MKISGRPSPRKPTIGVFEAEGYRFKPCRAQASGGSCEWAGKCKITPSDFQNLANPIRTLYDRETAMNVFTTMSPARLAEIVAGFPRLRIAVIGDFFLDKYLDIDPRMSERSLETGKSCDQVTSVRHSPGVAGTVVCNLSALGAGSAHAIGFTGADDSATAEAVLALAAGATLPEAALVGNLVASITVTQLATTGVARPEELPPRLELWQQQLRSKGAAWPGQ